MAKANKNGDGFNEAAARESLRRLAESQAPLQEFRILQELRQQNMAQENEVRARKYASLLAGANGIPPFSMREVQPKPLKYVDCEVVDTKPAPRRLPPPRDIAR